MKVPYLSISVLSITNILIENFSYKHQPNLASLSNTWKIAQKQTISSELKNVCFACTEQKQNQWEVYLFSKFYQNCGPRSLLTFHGHKMSCYNSWKASTIQNTLFNRTKQTNDLTFLLKSNNQLMEIQWSKALTRTIPATNAPQLNVPMSFGIEMNLKNKRSISSLLIDVKKFSV